MQNKVVVTFAAALLASTASIQIAAAGTTDELEAMVRAQQEQIAQQQQLLIQMQQELKALRTETQRTSKQLANRPAPVPAARAATPAADGQTETAAGEQQIPTPESYINAYAADVVNFYKSPTSKLDAATDEYVRAGGRPKAWRIPGTTFDLSIGGYAKADFIATVDGETTGAEDLFVVPGIITSDADGADDDFKLHAQESRFNLDITGDTEYGKFRAFLEGDFFGAGGNEVISNSSVYRLRHAFGQLGGLTAGQTWTTFMDVSALPNTLDFEGPGAESFIRQSLVRYTHDFGNGFSLAGAVENPESRAQNGTGSGAITSVPDESPDFVLRGRYEQSWGHLQLAAIGQRTEGPAGFSDDFGYGVSLSGKFNLPVLGDKDNFKFQTIYTDGASRYILDAAIGAGDVAFGPGGQIDNIEAFSIYGALQHYWADNLRSSIVGSYVEIDRPDFFVGPSALESTFYVVGNLIWSPVPNVDLGIELQYGERTDEDGDEGDATRIQSSAIFRF